MSKNNIESNNIKSNNSFDSLSYTTSIETLVSYNTFSITDLESNNTSYNCLKLNKLFNNIKTNIIKLINYLKSNHKIYPVVNE